MKEHQIIFTKKLISNALVASSILATGAASAAGFALREQSAYGQGSSFAGVAAGGSISTAFWNPANTAEVKGTQIEGMASIISAKSVVNDTGISNIIYRNLEDTGDIGGTTLLPALYYAKEHDEKVSWGVSLTVPYGSSTEAGRGSKSQYVSVKAEAKSLSDLTTPASFTLGIKHQATEKLNIGITAENVKWSSVGTLPVISQQSGSIVRLGSTPIAIPLNYEDSMYYSIGGELTRDNTRTTQLPDNDRYWLSLGFSKNLKSGMRFDLGYTYVFLKLTLAQVIHRSVACLTQVKPIQRFISYLPVLLNRFKIIKRLKKPLH